MSKQLITIDDDCPPLTAEDFKRLRPYKTKLLERLVKKNNQTNSNATNFQDTLVSRIRSVVKHSNNISQSVISTGDLVVNLDKKIVEINGQHVHLTGKEYQILELLSLRKGSTLTNEMFLNHLYGGMDNPDDKIIPVFMTKLRRKLANVSDGKNYIHYIWGNGYELREPNNDFKSQQLAS